MIFFMINLEILGNILKNKRKENGYTQKEVADRLEISLKTISNIEAGKDFTVSNLLAYATLLGCYISISEW